jgi:hypothetical protein
MHADATNQMQQITRGPAKVAHALRGRSVHKKTAKKRFAPSFYCFYCRGGPLGAAAVEHPSLRIEIGKSKRTWFSGLDRHRCARHRYRH